MCLKFICLKLSRPNSYNLKHIHNDLYKFFNNDILRDKTYIILNNILNFYKLENDSLVIVIMLFIFILFIALICNSFCWLCKWHFTFVSSVRKGTHILVNTWLRTMTYQSKTCFSKTTKFWWKCVSSERNLSNFSCWTFLLL